MTKIASKKAKKHSVAFGLPKAKKHSLTGAEMALHPAFGIWKHREDIADSTKFINAMREKEGKRGWK